MNSNKQKIFLYLTIALFGIIGIFFTFIKSDTKSYDSETKAYKIEENPGTDSDGDTVYYPIYYYKVNDKKYVCKSKTGSSSTPKESKNTVYYDSNNPENCMTQYEKSSGKTAGIICLIIAGILIVLSLKKTSNNNQVEQYNNVNSVEFEQNMEKAVEVVDKIQLIVKKIIIGISILVVLVLILVDTAIAFQTIKAKDFIETKAIYFSKKEDNESNISDDYIYSFEDKNGNKQEITVSIPKDSTVKESIKIKYNEKDPTDYYEENALLDKSGIIWYVVKIVILFLLIMLFFNNKILNKFNLSIG